MRVGVVELRLADKVSMLLRQESCHEGGVVVVMIALVGGGEGKISLQI